MVAHRVVSVRGGIVALLFASLVGSGLAFPAPSAIGAGADVVADPPIGIGSPSLPAPPSIDPGVSPVSTFVGESAVAKKFTLPGVVDAKASVAGDAVKVEGLPVELRVLTPSEVSALETRLAKAAATDAAAAQPVDAKAPVTEDGRPIVDDATTQGHVWSPSDEWVAGVEPSADEAAKVPAVPVEVSSLSQDALSGLGAQGFGFTVRPSVTLDQPVWVEVDVDYSGFRYLFGADWTNRLQLSQWDCPAALAAQGSKLCGDSRPVDGVKNNEGTGRLRAVIELSSGRVIGAFGRGFAKAPGFLTGDGSTLGLTTQEGSFAATSLSTAGAWNVGGNSGAFSYQVSVATPPALSGGPAPTVSLSYDSSGADALTGRTNSQASEVGVGWGVSAGEGFIERRYQPCTEVGGGTGDTCWYVQNATISLNGHASELVPINGTIGSHNSFTQFRLEEDPDWLVERVPDTSADGYWWTDEYWKVTTPEGFTYWFGQEGEGQNSRLKMPIRGITSGYPCYSLPSHICTMDNPSAGIDTSMPYRWMLDKVTDPFGNDMIYKYETFTNWAKTLGDSTKAEPYDADALLTEVDYGRSTQAGITSFRDKVTFTYVRRCTDAISTVATSDNQDSVCPVIQNSNGSHYPDIPTDLYCTGAPCTKYPSFFHIKRLTGIATYTSANGSSWTPVGQWRLVGSFPATGDYTNEKLFLESVQRMDPATSPIGTQGTGLLPATRFAKTAYSNRKDGSVSGGVSFQPIYRVTGITDEMGKQTSVTYEGPDYTTFVSWISDTSNDYPQWLTWGTSSGWGVFRRWVVNTVTVRDLVTGPSGQTGNAITPLETWDYTYNGGAAKHHTGDEWWQPNNQSWNVWRGYGEIVVTHGTGTTKTVTKTRYYRGMHGDQGASGTTKTVQLTRSWATTSEPLAAAVNDEDWLAGNAFEEFQMDGTGTSYLSSTRNYSTWMTNTAAVTVKTGIDRWYRKWRMTLTYSRLRDGTAASPTWRDRRTDTSVDTLGRVTARNDTGFLDTSGDETCTLSGYLSASTVPTPGNFGWMNLPAFSASFAGLGTQPNHVTWAAGSCDTSSAFVTDSKTYYNGNAHESGGAILSAGSQAIGSGFKPIVTAKATRVSSASTGNTAIGLWQVAKSTYDTAGRVVTTIDPRGYTTTFGFDSTYGYPNSAAYPISGLATSTVLDPASGQPLSKTDQNANVTTFCYDNLGRLRQAYLPGQTVNCAGDGAAAAARFTYDIGTYTNDATSRDWKTPSIVTTSVLQSAGVRIDSAAYLDGYGRTRETQTASPTSGKIIVSGVAILDDRTNAVTGVEAFAITDTAAGDRTSASGGLRGFAAWPNLPTTAGTLRTVESVFDTTNRVTSTTRKYGTTTLVTSSTAYFGTKTVVTPQIGSMTATTVDAFGRTVKSELYNGTTAPSGISITNGSATTTTAYSWNTTTGQNTTGYLTTTVTDDAGNQTVTVADLGGRVVSNNDPNAGLALSAYDLAGNITKIDDANTTDPVWMSYDALNRPILRYSNASGATPTTAAEKLAEWVYDGPSGTPAAGFKGLLVKETSWQSGQPYTQEVTVYDRNRPTRLKWIIPGTFGTDPLAGEWRYQYSYDEAGHQVTMSSPPGPVNTGAADPTFDVVTTHYNAYGAADTLIGADLTHQYVAATVFDDLGRITQRTLSRTNNGASEAAMVRSYVYDATTGALSNIRAGWDTTPTDISTTTWFQNDQYTRDAIGNVTKIDDLGLETSGTASGTKECFVYDQWNRLVRAHTATAATTCLTNTTASPVTNQGLDPYDTVWAFDDINRMSSRTDKLAATTTAYSYTGTKHAVTKTTTSGVDTFYGYNAAGSMTTRAGTTLGSGDALGYDNQGRLTSYGTDSYTYTTSNQRLVRTQGSTTTLYLPGMEAALIGATRTITRFRAIGSTTVAVEADSTSSVYWSCGNEQNSTTCQAAANAGVSPAVPARRRYQPYGNARGSSMFTTTDHGFLGQPEDSSDLAYLNNRYYDPDTAAFVSVDPLSFQTGTPYTYGSLRPATLTDPSGLGTCSNATYVPGVTNSCDNLTEALDSNRCLANSACDGAELVGTIKSSRRNRMSYSGITFVAIDVAHQGNIDKLDGNWSSKDITDASSQVHLKEILEQLGITGDFGTWLAALIGGVATRLTDNKSDWETIDHEKGVLEKVADAAAWVGNHVDLSATICLGYCLGIGTQGATVYMQTGWGCCFLSGSVGVSTKEYRDRSCETAVAGGNLGPVGVSTQVGNSSNDYELAWSPGLGYGAALITNHDVLGTRYC